MKEKVMALAQGKFTYEQPQLRLSTEKLELTVTEGGEVSASFRVWNAAGTRLKGFGATEDFHLDFFPVFDGRENDVTVKVFAGQKKAGETWTGELSLITDCGEYTLPYEVRVVERVLEGVRGEVKNYEEFVEYAKEDFEAAVALFYHDKFENIYLSAFGDKRLYQHLTMKNPRKQALEEFLVSHGDKKPVRYAVEQKKLSYDIGSYDSVSYDIGAGGVRKSGPDEPGPEGELVISRKGWGLTNLKVTSDQEFVKLEKEHLYDSDFHDDRAVLSFRIIPEKVTEGWHRGHIILENVYEKLEIEMCVHGVRGQEERKKRIARKKLVSCLTRNHIRYMMNSSWREKWILFLQENREELVELFDGGSVLYEGYLGYLTRNEEEKQEYLSMVGGVTEPERGASASQVEHYLTARYLKAKIVDTTEEREQFCEQVKFYYANGYRNWRILVLLERAGGFRGKPGTLMEELDSLWKAGQFSPYMHLYHIMLVLQETDLVKKLDEQDVGMLRFALKHDLINEDIVIAISFLSARKRRCTPALLSLLESCYKMFRNRDTLYCICALLIRSEKMEPGYFKWFQLGVENRLRLTELFEYYMYTLDKESFDRALPTVVSYFQYENHLRDSIKAYFYASIVKNRKEHPEYFEIYRKMIGEYVFAQLQEHRINERLACLYEAFVFPEDVRGQVAQELPRVMFAHRIHCQNLNMERVVVIHDEDSRELVYNLNAGEGIVHIATPHYRIYFVDRNGYYHAGTVKYKLEKILNLDYMSVNCYENGSENPLLLLYVFSEAIRAGQIGSREAIILHTMVREDVLGTEYRAKALFSLYEYYKSIGEDSLLEEIIGRMDFRYMSASRQAGVLQTMIQHKMNDAALHALRKYEILNMSRKLILLLITWKLEENDKFDAYYMRLCYWLYKKGTKNRVTMQYLINYYMGLTNQLHEIYKTGLKTGVEISDGGTERLLGQVLFAEIDPEPFGEMFLDYFEYGANRVLVRAFIGETAYRFLVGRTKLTDKVREKIQRESLSDDNQVMVLAMLKDYAGRQEYTASEKEYIQYHLSRYAASGQIFSFMKDFVGKVEVPFEICHCELIQIYYSGKGELSVELTRETQGEEPEEAEVMTFSMKKVFEDIYVYRPLLFYGESLRYKVLAGEGAEPVAEGWLTGKEWKGQPDSFYAMVNEMIGCERTGDVERFRELADEYQEKQGVAKTLFSPVQ